jgi:glyoxylate/hydroxypyruvate reductase A
LAPASIQFSKLREHPEMLPLSIPLFRLEDTGMGLQMQEYAVSQVLHWFRRFDDYQALKQRPAGSRWRSIARRFHHRHYGRGRAWRESGGSLQSWGFPLRVWSRSRKSWPQVTSFAGEEELGVPQRNARADQPAAQHGGNRWNY